MVGLVIEGVPGVTTEGAWTLWPGVMGVAALLLVAVSPGVPAVALNGPGVLPAVPLLGVMGTCTVLLALGASGPALLQATVLPLVVQLQPLLLKVAGAVTPLGKVMVMLIDPVVVAVPLLVTITGTALATPSIRRGAGWPMAVVRSGASIAAAVLYTQAAAKLSLASLSSSVALIVTVLSKALPPPSGMQLASPLFCGSVSSSAALMSVRLSKAEPLPPPVSTGMMPVKATLVVAFAGSSLAMSRLEIGRAHV